MTSFCDELPQFQLSTSGEVKDLRSTLIVNCVFKAFLSYTAIMLNIITIHAMKLHEENLVVAKDFKNIAPEFVCF